MPPRKDGGRSGRGVSSSSSSRYTGSSRFRPNSTPRAASGARSSQPSATPGHSRASATPAPSRQSVTPAPVRLQSRVRIAQSQSGTPDPLEDDHDRPSRDHPLHESEADDDADALNEVILAVDLRERGTVGCAYYVARDEKLYFMEDARLGGVETIEARKSH